MQATQDHEAPATLEFAAGLEFEPWTDVDQPPTSAQWQKAENPFLVNVRICWHICKKTKPELVEMIEKMAKDDPDVLDTMLDGISDAKKFFAYFQQVLSTAEARMFAAGSVVALSQEDKS